MIHIFKAIFRFKLTTSFAYNLVCTSFFHVTIFQLETHHEIVFRSFSNLTSLHRTYNAMGHMTKFQIQFSNFVPMKGKLFLHSWIIITWLRWHIINTRGRNNELYRSLAMIIVILLGICSRNKLSVIGSAFSSTRCYYSIAFHWKSTNRVLTNAFHMWSIGITNYGGT